MKRKDFLKNGLIGIGAIVGIPTVLSSCKPEEGPDGCRVSPSETAGPFPIKSPADLVRANIVSDRQGIALLITLTIQNSQDNCNPLTGVFVDVWHCDSEGHYSEYVNNGDFTQKDFHRGRQTTDTNGQVSFISLYPGWYPGRAPHIHVEVLDADEKSLLVIQVAFPDDISDQVYASMPYVGAADTTTTEDGIFSDSLNELMGTVTGNMTDGYVLTHTLVVKG